MIRRQLLPAARILLVVTVLVGLAYPLVVTGLGVTLLPHRAGGSQVEVDGRTVGSESLGQSFVGEGYFWPRPSAAGPLATGSLDVDGEPADPADLSQGVSGGSNLGPTSDELLDEVARRVVAYREAHGLGADVSVPVDAVTSSGSGLDPHISVANARIQALRVAEARGVAADEVLTIVAKHTDGRVFGFLGEPGVDVLSVNLALDSTFGPPRAS